MHSLQQRKAAAMKQQPMMGAFGAPPHGAHPTLLAQYQEYASRLNHHISQMQREGGGAGASAMGHMGGASAMGYPPQMQHAGGQQQQQQQQQMAAAQGAAGGDTAQWEAAVKQQQEQHFQHLYMQWHFEQQMHQMGQWQQYQQQMAAAQGAPEGPLQYSGSQAGSSSPTGAPPRAL